MNDKEICRLFNRIYKKINSSQQTSWFNRVNADKAQKIFAIEVEGVYVGNVGLKYINPIDKKAEYYIFIGDKGYWGKGIGTIATKMILRYCLFSLKLHKVYLHVDLRNFRAIKLYKKSGFKLEGVLKDELLREGKYLNMARMAIINKL